MLPHPARYIDVVYSLRHLQPHRDSTRDAPHTCTGTCSDAAPQYLYIFRRVMHVETCMISISCIALHHSLTSFHCSSLIQNMKLAIVVVSLQLMLTCSQDAGGVLAVDEGKF